MSVVSVHSRVQVAGVVKIESAEYRIPENGDVEMLGDLIYLYFYITDVILFSKLEE